MKVVQILYSGLGGHGSVVTSLIDGDRHGEWQHALVFYGIEDLLPAYQRFCDERGIGYSLVRKQRGIHRPQIGQVLDALSHHRPDAIILHSPSLCAVVWAYCRLRGTRFIGVDHTPIASKTNAEWFASATMPLLASRVVYLTPAYRDEMKRRVGLVPGVARAAVIQNGIDTGRYAPGRPRDPASALELAMIGRFSSAKNQLLLVRAFARLLREGRIDPRAVLHLAGTGEQMDHVKAELDSSGLRDHVVMHGLLDEPRVVELLQNIDLYVHASKGETMCTSVMQAMSCGLPIVASDIAGIRELLTNGREGILFEAEDQAALERSIVELASNFTRRSEMASAARSRAVAELSNTRMFAAYNELLATP
jgi:glycosyltransferase involved in cell wall biosynthesis